ncbi:MAG: thioredoxin domain-containing protein [Deltaproteobacteria bacterium]|nr:thioredoxin domain-containing protein [Deltaproteobacteria bacterium]
MARKGATQWSDPGRRPGTPAAAASPTTTTTGLEWGLLAALGLSAALSATILYVHAQLAATRGAYTSFCNVNSWVNCDVVLTSSYGSLFGLPIALWALLTYAGLAVLVLVRRRTHGEMRARATLLLVALAVWSFVFSLYMAVLAAFAVGALCLLCSGLYLLNGVICALTWRLGQAAAPPAGSLLTPRRMAIGAAAMAAALAMTGGSQLMASSATALRLTPADVQVQNPDFYNWYTSRPVVDGLPEAEHVRGPADALITIVEFSDFECNYCAKAFRDLRDFEQRHGGSVRVVFHHFPLDSECNARVPSRVHRTACDAAIAAECAARFGRFWDYHDRLFQDPQPLIRDELVRTAVDLGIDRAAFAACLDDPAARARVVADADAGAHLGIKSTPTLFINGRTVEGALDRGAYEWMLAMEHHG